MSLLLMDDGGSVRPPIQQQPRIAPPWDPSDGFGNVYTAPPPEFNPAACPYFMQTDFTGVTISGNSRWTGPPATPGSFITLIDGPWQGLVVPWVNGANSTPPTMIMTPMLPLYPSDVQRAVFTEMAWRGYTDFVMAPDPWNADLNNYQGSIAKSEAWAALLTETWNFRVILWRGGRPPVGDPYLQALYAATLVHFYIAGKEVDGQMIAEDYPPVLNQAIADTQGTIPIGAHFSATPFVDAAGNRIPNGGSYPIGFPRETFLAGGATGSWADHDGILHLTNQVYNDQSVGLMGAMQGYARQRVNLGGVGGDGRPAPNSRVYAYETKATSELYGQCDELTGKRVSLELNYCPAGAPGIAPMAGSGNGLSDADGWPVLRVG